MSSNTGSGWRDLWHKEDWWAVWLGLGLVIVASVAGFERVRDHLTPRRGG